MSGRKCSIEECSKPRRSNGFCGTHYARYRKWGDPLYVKEVHFSDPEEAFAARTRRDGDCIVWTGAKYPSGYGQIRINNKLIRAHRYAWERVNGPIADGLIVDHMCWNRACVNVAHLRLGTDALNRQNLSGAYKNSGSGIRGVHFHKASGLWQSRLSVGGVTHSCYSKTAEEAERKVIAMRRELMPFSQEPQEES